MSSSVKKKGASKRKPARKPKTREEAKLASREALIKGAIELFAEEGLDVSLDDLCAHAGYTRGAFYVHFKDRDELLAAVMERVGAGVLDALLGPEQTGVSDDLMSISQRFLAALVGGQYPLTKRGGMRPYQLLDACARSPAIRDLYVSLVQNSMDRLAASIGESQKRKQVRSDVQPDPVAQMLLATVIGLHTLYDLDVPVDLAQGAQTLFTLLAPAARK